MCRSEPTSRPLRGRDLGVVEVEHPQRGERAEILGQRAEQVAAQVHLLTAKLAEARRERTQLALDLEKYGERVSVPGRP